LLGKSLLGILLSEEELSSGSGEGRGQLGVLLVTGKLSLNGVDGVEELHESGSDLFLSSCLGSGSVDWEHEGVLVIFAQSDFWQELLLSGGFNDVELNIKTSTEVGSGNIKNVPKLGSLWYLLSNGPVVVTLGTLELLLEGLEVHLEGELVSSSGKWESLSKESVVGLSAAGAVSEGFDALAFSERDIGGTSEHTQLLSKCADLSLGGSQGKSGGHISWELLGLLGQGELSGTGLVNDIGETSKALSCSGFGESCVESLSDNVTLGSPGSLVGSLELLESLLLYVGDAISSSELLLEGLEGLEGFDLGSLEVNDGASREL